MHDVVEDASSNAFRRMHTSLSVQKEGTNLLAVTTIDPEVLPKPFHKNRSTIERQDAKICSYSPN